MEGSLIYLLLLIGLVNGQNYPRIPPNPCPTVFNYYSDTDSRIFGEILVPNDGTKVFRIEVNTSYIGLFDERTRPVLQLNLVTPNNVLLQSKQLTYKLNFNRQDVIPRITQIKFNGRVYCSGSSEQLTSEGVSELWISKETRIQSYTYYTDQTKPLYTTPIQTTPSYPEYWTQRPIPMTGGAIIAPAPLTDNSDNECGIADKTMNVIYDGTSMAQNQFPWLVALYEWQGLNYEFRCTANLVDKKHVVTVAHCIRFYNSYLVPPENIVLVLGTSYLKHWAENSNAVLRNVIRVDVHPNYQQYTGHGDLVVLTLNEPVQYSRAIKPICLWDGNDDLRYVVGQYGTVAGWGKDDQQQEYLLNAKEVTMPIVSTETCLRSNREFQKLTTHKTFCAGERNGKGPCAADSGSPLMLEKNRKYVLRGLVSQAVIDAYTSTCNLREYVVFADVAKYSQWIKSKLY